MIIKYNKEINIESLTEQIELLGEKFRILLNDGLEIELFDIRSLTTNEVNENEEVISTSTIYQKRHKETNMIDGEEVKVDVWEDYNFDIELLNSIIANHDKVKSEQKKDIIDKIKDTDSELVRGLEDLYEWAEIVGFTPAQVQKDRISERKSLRSQLNSL